jgi:hypothetical protein
MGDIQLFVSHAHKDREIAEGIVDLIETALVREGRILCTSHRNPAYGYPEGIDVSEHLREHLSEASCVVALLTPYSLESPWCLFELGGAWARATKTYPLVAGGVAHADLPAALKGKFFGKLEDRQDLRRLLLNLSMRLRWDQRNMELATGDPDARKPADSGLNAFTIDDLVSRVQNTKWLRSARSIRHRRVRPNGIAQRLLQNPT